MISITYAGSRYHGWQRQTNTRHTIQEVLETQLSRLANSRVCAQASGRTDAGVHARVQVVHADLPDTALRLLETPSAIPGESRLKQALNSLLPRDIRVLRIERVHDDFHATRDARKKTYLYFIDPSPVQLPELSRYSWNLRMPLDWEPILEATRSLQGRHDFKAFCGKGSQVKSTTRTLYEAWWGEHLWHGMGAPVRLHVLRLTGNGFLKQMVRSIVGTLVQIGSGKAPVERVSEMLESGHRSLVGPTAPPQGLWLWDVLYRGR